MSDMQALEEAQSSAQVNNISQEASREASGDDPEESESQSHESNNSHGKEGDTKDSRKATEKAEKARKKQEEKERKAEEKARKKQEKDREKTKGRLGMEGMIDKAIRMLSPMTDIGEKPWNAVIKDQRIPSRLIRSAKGLAFLTIAKTGLVLGVQAGMGIIIARQPDGNWSPPAAFQTGGMSCGILIGASVVDLLLIINTDEQLKMLSSRGMVKLGADLEVTTGPLGRNAQASVAAGNKGVAGCYAYSFSKGIFGGISLDGGALWPYSGENARFYGQEVRPEALFTGTVPPPEGNEVLTQFQVALQKLAEYRTMRATSSSNASAQEEEEEDDSAVPDVVNNYFKERDNA